MCVFANCMNPGIGKISKIVTRSMAIMGLWICNSAPTKLLYISQDKYAARLYDFKV